MKTEREKPEQTLFDNINEYLVQEAPERVENPTIERLAEKTGITQDTLNHWLDRDKQFRDELTRLKDFQINDPFKV